MDMFQVVVGSPQQVAREHTESKQVRRGAINAHSLRAC